LEKLVLRPVLAKSGWASRAVEFKGSVPNLRRMDPRWGTQTRKIIEISRGEPDPEYFSIPADYNLLDNRPSAEQ
jgi:hypothetical protein